MKVIINSLMNNIQEMRDAFREIEYPTDITEYLNHLKTINFRGMKRVLVCSSHHWTPIFILFRNNSKSIFISDSLGGQTNSFTTRYIKKIQKSKMKNARVYYVRQSRQRDPRSCPVFSLADMQTSVHIDLFRYLFELESTDRHLVQEDKALSDSGLNYVFSIEKLPAQMMRMTQSLSELKSYNEKYPDQATIPISLFGTLEQTVIQFTHPDTNGKLVNFYAQKTFFEYVSWVIHNML